MKNQLTRLYQLFPTASVFLASALLVSSSLAAPLSTCQLPATTAIYWIGYEDCGGPFTVNGTLTPGQCSQIFLPSLKVEGQPSTACTYAQFEGLNCSGTAISTTDILAGDGFSTCIATDVLDGGAHTVKSALYTC